MNSLFLLLLLLCIEIDCNHGMYTRNLFNFKRVTNFIDGRVRELNFAIACA